MPPFLNVDDVLLDPMFTSEFNVVRREERIDAHGRSAVVPTLIPSVYATMCESSGNDLLRLPEDQRMGRNYSLVSQFKFRGPAEVQGTNWQPDVVLWNGDTFVVKHVSPYTQYGAGFTQTIIGSMDSVDTPPLDKPDDVGAADFAQPGESDLLGVL